jgi:DNA helicase-2/ATP-dependent DNA helicase PcrA
MDFDDLLYFTNTLLTEHPDVLHYYQQKFKFILVDEYQDTNFAQYLIVKKLAAAYENLCVVGDDAQSIYSFRGANIENILNFRKDYPDFQLFKLEQNYRSTQIIVDAANSVIQRNHDQIKKVVWTENGKGKPISVVRTLTDNEEGRVIAGKIFDVQHSLNSSYNDFAILYRTNKQSRSFEEALRKLNIPYKIYGGLSFYQRKEIKDVLAYFRLVANPQDEEALKRVINYPKRGIGKTSVENLIISAGRNGVSMWEVLSDFTTYPVDVSTSTRQRMNEFTVMVQSFQAELNKLDAYTLAERMVKSSGILAELNQDKDKGPEEIERIQNVEELLAGLQEFSKGAEEGEIKTLSDFLMDVALLTDTDQEKTEDKNHVSLMTIHSSKGLEFPFVYIVGMEENLFPSQLSTSSRTELEEERRLFYVALTRAMQSCTLSYAGTRFLWNQSLKSEPSRFLNEIDAQYLHLESPVRSNTGKSLMGGGMDRPFIGGINTKMNAPILPKSLKSLQDISAQPSSNPRNFDQIIVGTNVEHNRFGKGRVTKIEGIGADKKAVIFFPHHGSKTVLLQFANLKVI